MIEKGSEIECLGLKLKNKKEIKKSVFFFPTLDNILSWRTSSFGTAELARS